MKKKYSIRNLLLLVTILLTAGAIFSLFFALNQKDALSIILASIVSLLLFLVSAALWYILFLSMGKKHNIFLYDNKTKKNISVDEIKFTLIREKLSFYFGFALASYKQTPLDGFIARYFDGGMPEIYKPLLMPFIFWACIDKNDDNIWIWLIESEKQNVDFIENKLLYKIILKTVQRCSA